MSNKTSNTVQAFWVLLGSLSAFGFTVVSSAILSRYFNKYDYGTYKQIMYVYGALLFIFTLGLPRAFSYFLPRVNKGQAKDLISKINRVLLIMGGIMSIYLWLGADLIAGFLKNKDLALPLRYFSLVPLFMLPTMGLEGVLATYQKTMFLAIYNTISKIFMLLCVVVPVVYFKGGVNVAVIGFTVSSFFCFLIALFLKYYPLKGYSKEKSPYSYREVLNYTLPIMGASIWGIIITSTDQFFISRYFGNKVFAEFANGSLELPFVGMIIASTSTVLSPVFAKQIYENGNDAKEEVIKLWRGVLNKTIKLIYPVVVFCFCFADILMVLLYGEQYHNSGIYFQIKLVVNFFTVIAYAPLVLSIGGQKYYFMVHMVGAIILFVLEWGVISIYSSPYLITVVSVLCQIGRIVAMLLFVCNYFKIRFIDLFPFKLIGNIIAPSFIFLYVIRYVLSSTEIDQLLKVLIAFIIYVGIFGLWAYYKNIDYLSIIKPVLQKIKK